MTEVGIQLYTLRRIDDPLDRILGRIEAAGYDGVELMRDIDERPRATIREAIDGSRLSLAGAHAGLDLLRKEGDWTAEMYRRLGCEDIVLSGLRPERFLSERTVDTVVDHLLAIAATLERHGIDLHYHNHDHEFNRLNGETGYDHLAARSGRFGLELDTGTAAAAGADPVRLLREFGDAISRVHLTDVRDTTPTELGEGTIDVPGCLDAAREADCEWLIYEHHDPDDPYESMEHGVEYLRSNLR